MPSARRSPFPTAPDLPAEFEPAPATLASGDVWEQLEADAGVEVAPSVADAQLHETVWTNAQLVGRRFTGLVCQDVRFVAADLAGLVLEDCRFTRVVFEACRMSGAIFAGATLQDVELIDCVADLADFRMANVRRTAARHTVLRGADLYGCALTDVRLMTCDLSAANFDTARAERLDLRGSIVDGLRGVASLGAAHIDADQVAPLGAALIGALDFRIDS